MPYTCIKKYLLSLSLCPSLFMISKTLGLSQNIAGVTFLAFGNTSADIFAAINGIRLGKPDLVISVIYGKYYIIMITLLKYYYLLFTMNPRYLCSLLLHYD